MYNVLLALHVITAGIWVALLPAVLILNALRKKYANTSGELHYMAAASRLGLIQGMIGSFGILLTGPGLEGMSETYAWFDFANQSWLAWKQSIFVVIFLLSMGVMMPKSKRIRKMLGELLDPKRANTGASDELRDAFGGFVTLSLIINSLVLINMILGEIRP